MGISLYAGTACAGNNRRASQGGDGLGVAHKMEEGACAPDGRVRRGDEICRRIAERLRKVQVGPRPYRWWPLWAGPTWAKARSSTGSPAAGARLWATSRESPATASTASTSGRGGGSG